MCGNRTFILIDHTTYYISSTFIISWHSDWKWDFSVHTWHLAILRTYFTISTILFNHLLVCVNLSKIFQIIIVNKNKYNCLSQYYWLLIGEIVYKNYDKKISIQTSNHRCYSGRVKKVRKNKCLAYNFRARIFLFLVDHRTLKCVFYAFLARVRLVF